MHLSGGRAACTVVRPLQPGLRSRSRCVGLQGARRWMSRVRDPALGAPAAVAEGSSGGSEDEASVPAVQVSYRGATFSTPRGTTLRTALLTNGLSPHNGNAQVVNCRGLGTCGTCAVEVKGPGAVAPAQKNAIETARLNFPPHKPPNNQCLRLACQVQCMGDMEVIKKKKFWGQGDEAMPDVVEGECWAPLGDVEYILDRNRRSAPR